MEQDIQKGQSYVCDADGQLLAVFVFFCGEEPTYREIFDGQWPDDGPYGVLHRIVVARQGRGVARACYDWCSARCRTLRADTHLDNLPMQRSLQKAGFVRCGVIYVEDGSPREAFSRPEQKNPVRLDGFCK